jgi:hypothetical protein
MGTSTSFRAPLRPRWHAFIAALEDGSSLERIRSELFNAGDEWESALAAPAVAAFADSLLRLWDELPRRVETATSPADFVVATVAEARGASSEAGYSPALPIAERAFTRLLIATASGAERTDPSASAQMASRWREQRGDEPRDLLTKYLGEVLGQYARHVTDREAGRRVIRERGATASSSIAEALAQQAVDIGTASATSPFVTAAPVRDVWARLVARAFTQGRALPKASA